MNTGFFTGNIGRDAELRHANNGDQVANFPLAIEVGTKLLPKTMWIDCSLWGKRAENLSRYLTKGKRVAIVGRINQDEYTKRDGGTGFRIQVSCNEVEFIGGRVEQESQPAESAPAKAKSPRQQAMVPDEFEDEIPF